MSSLLFSLFASLLIWATGRRDPSRDPRLTAASILLLLLFPLLGLLPKLHLLPAASVSAQADGLPLFRYLWLAGFLICLGRLFASFIFLHRWRSRSRLIDTLEIKGRCPVELRVHPLPHGPLAAGVLRPFILVPEAWHGWSPETRDIVIAHELAHHRRRDPLWRVLAALTCAVHWFNPLVWWLARRHAAQAEFACDALVIARGIPSSSYASILCDLASSIRPPAATVPMAETSSLAVRVSRLMNPRGEIHPRAAISLIAGMIVLALLLSLLRRADSAPTAIPASEIQLRLSANPFPANQVVGSKSD